MTNFTLFRINSSLAACILLTISLLHLYWATGGNFALQYSLPTREGQPLIRPSRFATLLVAAALFSGACLLAGIADVVPRWLSITWHVRLAWAWAVVFGLRGLIGGVLSNTLSSYKRTEFAKWDRRLYAPLCLYLCVSFAWVIRLFT